MVLHKHVDGENTNFFTMAGTLVNNHLVKWLVVIRRGTYQANDEDIRWSYETVSDLWPDVETDSDSSYNVSGDE